MIEPVRVESGICGLDIVVGSGYRLSRMAPDRHARQLEFISTALAFAQIAVRERHSGTFVLEADGEIYHVSGAYAGGAWHFALSHQRLGFDVIDLYEVPDVVSDLGPLLDRALCDRERDDMLSHPVSPYLLQLCAAEAVAKLLRIGLDRAILRIPFLDQKDGRWELRNNTEVPGRGTVTLVDASPLLRQDVKQAHLIGVLAAPARLACRDPLDIIEPSIDKRHDVSGAK
jgi:hypothetical protein